MKSRPGGRNVAGIPSGTDVFDGSKPESAFRQKAATDVAGACRALPYSGFALSSEARRAKEAEHGVFSEMVNRRSLET
jgi:hypothetical protein